MKKILLILLLFLLPLYLVPPTSAAYGDESPDSITSFSETLPDDVLYYPDFDLESNVSTTTEYIDNMESVSYWDSAAKDWDTWETADGALHTRHDSVGANEYPLRHMDWDDNDDPDPRPEVTEYDDTTYSWYLRFKVDYHDSADYFRIGFYDTPWGGTSEWFNLLTYSKNVWHYVEYDPTTTMTDLDRIDVNAQLDNGEYAELWLDWIAVIPTANNLDPSFSYDDTSFREGFNDVSDWYLSANETDDSFATDGDILTWSLHDDGNSDYLVTDVPSGVYQYFEIRFKYNTTDGGWITPYGRTEDYAGGDTIDWGSDSYLQDSSTDWITKKWAGTSDTVECIYFYGSSLEKDFSIDYLRASPANETGWQHDGSTIEGVQDIGDATSSSDGDILSIVRGAGGSASYIWVDTTVTAAELEPNYYQFLEICFTEATIGNGTAIYLYNGSATFSILSDQAITQTIYRFNIKAVLGSDTLQKVLIYSNTVDGIVEVDYIKAYSIANFTVAVAGGMPVTGLAYVDSGTLTITVTGGLAMSFNYDPVVSITSAIYTIWNLTLSSPYTTYVLFLWTGEWHSWTGETRGETPSGTITDIQFNLNTPVSISALKFIDTRDWQEIGEVDFVMPVGWDPTFIFGYDAFFIFLGLIMIPVSTMYLVRGGREEMSSDKLFYGLIIFAVGFGLLVGGIMP